jgi:NAD(P)-dependent dehydrogenase (short-subunit alcohol dehydrogenase family)
VIIVTGGSGLLGKEFINEIKNEGGVPINFDVSVETDIEKGEVNVDISSLQSIGKGLEVVLGRFSTIDGLVNNAYPRTKDWGAKFEDIPSESWKKNIDLQLNSVFDISQKVLKLFQKQGGGSIVNIASIYGVVGNDFTVYEGTAITGPAAYSAIKGGLINFTRYLASYYGKDNIRVNCVSPGGIFDNQPKPFVENYNAKVPMKRMGTPSDIAPAVAFLLSQKARYITGHNLVIDGGWTAI